LNRPASAPRADELVKIWLQALCGYAFEALLALFPCRCRGFGREIAVLRTRIPAAGLRAWQTWRPRDQPVMGVHRVFVGYALEQLLFDQRILAGASPCSC
jgi:hypothetical protein